MLLALVGERAGSRKGAVPFSARADGTAGFYIKVQAYALSKGSLLEANIESTDEKIHRGETCSGHGADAPRDRTLLSVPHLLFWCFVVFYFELSCLVRLTDY